MKMQKRKKKVKKGLVGRQNDPIYLKWAAMLPTLRTPDLDCHLNIDHWYVYRPTFQSKKGLPRYMW